MKHLILLRHGQSAWNLENRFTGWTDVELTDKAQEAAEAGRLIAAEGLAPIIASLRICAGPSTLDIASTP